MSKRRFSSAFLAVLFMTPQFGLERPNVTFKIFQFPSDKISRIDSNTDDWAMVPDSYAIGMDQLMDTEQGPAMNHDPKEHGRQGQGGLAAQFEERRRRSLPGIPARRENNS